MTATRLRPGLVIIRIEEPAEARLRAQHMKENLPRDAGNERSPGGRPKG